MKPMLNDTAIVRVGHCGWGIGDGQLQGGWCVRRPLLRGSRRRRSLPSIFSAHRGYREGQVMSMSWA